MSQKPTAPRQTGAKHTLEGREMMMKRGLMALLMIGALVAVGAHAQPPVVDYYEGQGPSVWDGGTAGPLNFAHALIAGSLGGDNDANGQDSRPWNGGSNTEAFRLGNGLPEGLEYSVFEYLYETPGANLHDLAVEVFNTNADAYWAFYVDPDYNAAYPFLSA
jgi:hypothetical protein